MKVLLGKVALVALYYSQMVLAGMYNVLQGITIEMFPCCQNKLRHGDIFSFKIMLLTVSNKLILDPYADYTAIGYAYYGPDDNDDYTDIGYAYDGSYDYNSDDYDDEDYEYCSCDYYDDYFDHECICQECNDCKASGGRKPKRSSAIGGNSQTYIPQNNQFNQKINYNSCPPNARKDRYGNCVQIKKKYYWG